MHDRKTMQAAMIPKRSTKHQTPNTREAPSSKFQARSAGRGLELGTWDFFGVWSLVFGVSIPGFLWSLGFGAWCFAQRRLNNGDASAAFPLPFFQFAGNPVFT
jgi:hypothetical protein